MKIIYANKRLEKYFSNYEKLKQKLPLDWVRSIKKHMNHLEAAECFGDFLSLRLGKPELLTGDGNTRYSLHISANARLILEVDATGETVKICTEVAIEGVCDYHGGKENWYLR